MTSESPSTTSSDRDSSWVYSAGASRTIATSTFGCSPDALRARRNSGQRWPLNEPLSLSDMMERNPPLTAILASPLTSIQTRSSGADGPGAAIPDPLDALEFCSRGPDSAIRRSETALPDGEWFSHLAPPDFRQQLITNQLPSTPIATETQSSWHRTKRIASSRKKKVSNDAKSLDELEDAPPGQRPSYPYLTLIQCAILSHPKHCPTLSEIYDLIQKRFSFFKSDDERWKNTVRHNLSMCPSFVKTPRHITEPGKGNYWTYDPDPPNKDSRRKKRTKRKPKHDSEFSARVGEYDDGGRVHLLPAYSDPPPFAPGGRHSHSYSSSAYVGEQGVAFRHESPTRIGSEARSLNAPGAPTQCQRDPVTLDPSVSMIERRSTSSVVSYPTTGDTLTMPRSLPAPLSQIGGSGLGGTRGEQSQDRPLSSSSFFAASWTTDELSLPASADYGHGGGSRSLQSMSGFQPQYLKDTHTGYPSSQQLPRIISTSSMDTVTHQYRHGGNEPYLPDLQPWSNEVFAPFARER